MGEKLTNKQQAFVLEYLACFNATEAAKKAGYKGNRGTLAVVGSENLRKPKILAEIRRFLEDKAMMQEETLARIAKQARGSMGDFLNTDADGGIRFDLDQAKKAGVMDVVQYVKIRPVVGPDGVTRQQVEVRLYDAQKALQMIGKGYGLFGGLEPAVGEVGERFTIEEFAQAEAEVAAWERERFGD